MAALFGTAIEPACRSERRELTKRNAGMPGEDRGTMAPVREPVFTVEDLRLQPSPPGETSAEETPSGPTARREPEREERRPAVARAQIKIFGSFLFGEPGGAGGAARAAAARAEGSPFRGTSRLSTSPS